MPTPPQPPAGKLKVLCWITGAFWLGLTEYLKTRPALVEKYYSTGLYPPIAKGLRWLLGSIPFSVGDLIIGGLIAFFLVRLFQFIVRQVKKRFREKVPWKKLLIRWTGRILLAYLFFYWLWGLNYYRKGSAQLLNIQPAAYTHAEVDSLLKVLHKRLDDVCADTTALSENKTGDRKMLSRQAVAAYLSASRQYPIAKWKYPSLKPNLLGPWQSHTGYGGYLFPYTGEAQVDFYVPNFVLPMTVCHEMAHQLGFGSESEANLIGFMAARSSASVAFRYSAYADMQAYALREMARRDTARAKVWLAATPAYLKRDRDLLTAYYKQRQWKAQALLDWVYNGYLKNTNQPEGLLSYNKVVAWLIAYAKKYGWDAL
jgi:hypothetical protein